MSMYKEYIHRNSQGHLFQREREILIPSEASGKTLLRVPDDDLLKAEFPSSQTPPSMFSQLPVLSN